MSEDKQKATGVLVTQLIANDLQLVVDETLLQNEAFEAERLEDWLTIQVKRLIDQEFAFFLNALYRMDVSEQSVKTILNTAPVDGLPKLLAKEILKREEQKVITRITYSSSDSY